MSNAYTAGWQAPVKFQATGQGAVATLAVKGHSWEEMVNVANVTNTSHGGIAAKWATILDGKGSVQADHDADAPPYLTPPKIYAGVTGLMLFYVSSTKFFQVPCVVTKLAYQTEVQGTGITSYSFEIEMDANSGSYIRPTS